MKDYEMGGLEIKEAGTSRARLSNSSILKLDLDFPLM